MSAPTFALIGRTDALSPAEQRMLFERGREVDPEVAASVTAMIADVRKHGDAALREYARRFDGVSLAALEVPAAALHEALTSLAPELRTALEQAADAIAAFHRAQLPEPLEYETARGVRLGRRAEPLGRVGVYAPGGRAAYASSVLMGVVPARVAGVREIIVCAPPGPDGRPPAAVLAAAALAGADRMFAVGGAGAIAAMAYGTESVPSVDRIVGPGNAYVTAAKQQVTPGVAIDCPAGPSEILIIADSSADARTIAAELLAQAEHDPDAACVLVSTEETLIQETLDAVTAMLPVQPRRTVIERALARAGALLVAPDENAALEFSERYAPEHLLLLTRSPRALLPRVRAAGSVFLGAGSSVVFGDYITGANHVLPTDGHARIHAGLSTLDFLRFSTWQHVSDEAASALALPAATLAQAEGLPAHADAARLRSVDAAALDAPKDGWSSPARPPRPVRLRAAYRHVSVYDPGRSPCALDLSDNTNLFGANPAAAAAVRNASDAVLTRYPDTYASELKRAIAAHCDVAPANVTTGCGSDDVIDSVMRAFCEPEDVVAYPDPTFGMIGAFTRMNAAQPRAVASASDFALDPAALRAQRAALTYVCRPNNPTGTLVDAAGIMWLEQMSDGVLVVDEAYIDFADDVSLAPVAAGSTRMIVLRTFSKAYGLAGLRVGYAIGPAALIAEIEKSRGPYKVSGLAERAALAALSEGRDWVRARADEVIANRARLAERLRELGLAPLPSAANFLLVPLPAGARAADWNVRLRARGVAVRPFSAVPGAGECLRVTIGPWADMERFLTAAAALRATTDAPEVTQ